MKKEAYKDGGDDESDEMDEETQMEEDLANFEGNSKSKKSASTVTIAASKRKPKLSSEKLLKKVIGSTKKSIR